MTKLTWIWHYNTTVAQKALARTSCATGDRASLAQDAALQHDDLRGRDLTKPMRGSNRNALRENAEGARDCVVKYVGGDLGGTRVPKLLEMWIHRIGYKKWGRLHTREPPMLTMRTCVTEAQFVTIARFAMEYRLALPAADRSSRCKLAVHPSQSTEEEARWLPAQETPGICHIYIVNAGNRR